MKLLGTRLFSNTCSDRVAIRSLLTGLLLAVAVGSPHADEATGASVQAVPVTQEPLHVVKHRGKHFLIYTNWIEPGVWTLYHEHHNDLLAVIVADTAVASQTFGDKPREQTAPAGTMVFFPYADSPTPYVHRVGVRGNGPFVNIGLEFQNPLSAVCASIPGWDEPRAQALPANRRGQAYRLILPAAAEVAVPEGGRGLLLVPLGTATLQVDEDTWNAATGDFRFYDHDRPLQLHNTGTTSAALVVFEAC